MGCAVTLCGIDPNTRLVREFLRRINIEAVRETNPKCPVTVDVRSQPCQPSVAIEYGGTACFGERKVDGHESAGRLPLHLAATGTSEMLPTTDIKAMLAPFYVKPVAEAVSKK